MTDPRDDLLRALRDAYAMERHAESLLKSQVARSTPYAEINARIEAHLTETQANQESLTSCLERINASDPIPQTVADGLGATIETGNVVQTTDEVVRNLASLYELKQQEIASYTLLIAIAEASGFFETKIVCEAIVLQQTAMADWLLEHLPPATRA